MIGFYAVNGSDPYRYSAAAVNPAMLSAAQEKGSAAQEAQTSAMPPVPTAETALPSLRLDDNAESLSMRGQMQPVSEEQLDELSRSAENEKAKSPAELMEENECQTCANRKYQDGSDDPGVSFKSPTKLTPEQAATAVRGHEMEHVVREQAAAEREGREVVQQSVRLHTSICPDCGKTYISGGVTETTTMAKQKEETAAQQEALPPVAGTEKEE